jgi:hypothetical protein
MAATPIVGTNAVVTFVPSGGSLVTLKNSDWTYKPKNMVKEAPNTTDGMLRAAGLFDAEGTVKGHVDTTQPIESNITVGTIGVLKWYRNATKFFQATVIIEDLSIETGVDQTEDWDFTWKLQSGTVTNPA